MSNHTILKTLFTALHGSLPYEYDERYANSKNTNPHITITKENSERTLYITETTPDNDTLDVTLYNDTHDDEPTENYQWDTNDPNLNLTDLIANIKNSL